jgi:hypothetical protein
MPVRIEKVLPSRARYVPGSKFEIRSTFVALQWSSIVKEREVNVMEDGNRKDATQEVDALCPECGHAFKTYIDRVLGGEEESELKSNAACPVCGCGECDIVKPGT